MPTVAQPLTELKRLPARGGWLALYAITLALEWAGAIARFAVVAALAWLVLTVLGWDTGRATTIAAVAAWFPLAWSLLAILYPFGTGWLLKAREGAREPSERERIIFDDAITSLTKDNPGLQAPGSWFVLDDPTPNAGVLGRSIMVNRGLLSEEQLPDVLAHELGHLYSLDGDLLAAINRFVLWADPLGPAPPGTSSVVFRPLLRVLLFLAGGGLGLWVMRAGWGAWFRGREYAADAYAADLGRGPGLSEFLETHALFNDVPTPFIWLSDRSHPPTELRLDRLAHHDAAPAASE